MPSCCCLIHLKLYCHLTSELADSLREDTIVCRCEDVRWGSLRGRACVASPSSCLRGQEVVVAASWEKGLRRA